MLWHYHHFNDNDDADADADSDIRGEKQASCDFFPVSMTRWYVSGRLMGVAGGPMKRWKRVLRFFLYISLYWGSYKKHRF